MSEPADPSTLNYEQALGELDVLIVQLERGDVALDEAIRAYQRGSALAQRCAELLDDTEAAVTQLVVGAQGATYERPFAPTEAGAVEPPARGRGPQRPTAPPPPGAPARARTAGSGAAADPEAPAPAAAPGLFPGLEANPAKDAAESEFGLDDIPF